MPIVELIITMYNCYNVCNTLELIEGFCIYNILHFVRL